MDFGRVGEHCRLQGIRVGVQQAYDGGGPIRIVRGLVTRNFGVTAAQARTSSGLPSPRGTHAPAGCSADRTVARAASRALALGSRASYRASPVISCARVRVQPPMS